MNRVRLRSFSFVVVAVLTLLSTLTTLAEEATPTSSPAAADAACSSLFPPPVEGVSIEAVLSETEIPGLGPPAVIPTTVIACIKQGAPPADIEQLARAATIVVLSGELTVAFAEPRGTTPIAMYFLATNPSTSLPLTTTPVTLMPGDMLVYANVLLTLTPSTSTVTRVWATGIPDTTGGSGCPCIRWP